MGLLAFQNKDQNTQEVRKKAILTRQSLCIFSVQPLFQAKTTNVDYSVSYVGLKKVPSLVIQCLHKPCGSILQRQPSL